ncbi:MAG: uroporphyrinogen-III C-methyltransferase [Myxococcota bacterium]|nr:uroporphyrinogen-III C-methyltransferase [Myxococcota bacterium]
MTTQKPGTGRVFLVGAGPGDPELITLRGASALRRADAVIYDSLAARELLALAPPGALRIDVGKRGHDAPTRPQEEITDLMLRLAGEGLTVVRLKGGDPFVFGRGGEECSALAAAGVPFEVVPGVSSVVGGLAYAGMPLTDRRHSASFAVATGHKDPSKPAEETRWSELATGADTLVILMGMRSLESLVERVIAGGRSPATPAAVIMDGTLPSQRVVEAPLSKLAARVRDAGLGAPALVVIGEVVKLRESLAWLENRPLFGRRVLVTRPAHQAASLAAALRERGAEPVVVPLVEIAPPETWTPVDAALDDRADHDVLVLASANAATAFCERARARQVSLATANWKVCCVGPRTAEVARGQGLSVHVVPEQRDASGIVAALGRGDGLQGARVLLPRSAEGRQELVDGLRAGGAKVSPVCVYQTRPAEVDGAALRQRLIGGELHVLTFASPSAVAAFAALLDDPAREAASRCVVAAIGVTTAEALRSEGLAPDVVPERPGAVALAEALASFLAPETEASESGGGTV